MYAKTEEEYEDILDEWKKEFSWNGDILHQTVVDSTPHKIRELAEMRLEQETIAYCLKQ